MGSFSLIFGSLAGLNLRKGCSVALCGEHTRSLILIWSTDKRNQASPRHMAKGSNWGKSFSFFMKGDVLVVIADFPMTSLKFKLQNYRSDWDFTLMMYLIEQLKTRHTNLVKTFLQISRKRNISLTKILARVFAYLPPFIFQSLDFI